MNKTYNPLPPSHLHQGPQCFQVFSLLFTSILTLAAFLFHISKSVPASFFPFLSFYSFISSVFFFFLLLVFFKCSFAIPPFLSLYLSLFSVLFQSVSSRLILSSTSSLSRSSLCSYSLLSVLPSSHFFFHPLFLLC